MYANANTLRAKAEAVIGGCGPFDGCQRTPPKECGVCKMLERMASAFREVVQECAGIAKVEEAKCEAEAKQWHERHDYEMEHGASEAACAASAIADAIRARYGLGDA